MQIMMLLHLGYHSITLIFDMPPLLRLIVIVLLIGTGSPWFAKVRPLVIVRSVDFVILLRLVAQSAHTIC